MPAWDSVDVWTKAASIDCPPEKRDTANAMILEMSKQAQPVARAGQPIDIANAVAFLCSAEAGFMTGASLIVDGGITVGPRHAWDPNMPSMFAALQAYVEGVPVPEGAAA